MRILVAGFQHETNTFAPSKAGYADFVRNHGFPAMYCRGPALLDLRMLNVPAGGFIDAALGAGHEIEPALWAGAKPSAHVTEDAFERIAGDILDAARSARFDVIYLDLHGAMVAEHVDDGEGELLARLRQRVGRHVPIVGSLDLHANVTERMLTHADGLIAYRTYPHVDMAQTGRRAAAVLAACQAAQGRWHRASRRLPFLIPINAMCTSLEPARSIYALLAELERRAGVVALSFTPGFPAADFPECGPVLWGYGTDAEATERAVEELYQAVLAAESAWVVDFHSPAHAVQVAQDVARWASRPVVIADTQDNPGVGADADTTGLLRALVDARAEEAALGLICDPEAVALASQAGVGRQVTLSLGGRCGVVGDAPFVGTFTVEHICDGKCRLDGPMMSGAWLDLGATVCLRIGGVRVVVSSTKAQLLDRNLFRIAGVEPERMRILVVKSSVHFRADFEPIAQQVLVAKAPGPMLADPADLPWTRLAEGVRTRPLGEPFVRR